MKKVLSVFSVLLIVSFVFSACTPTAAPAPASQNASAPTTSASQNTVAPSSAAEATAAGKSQIRVAYAWPARIDPGVGADFFALTLHLNIYDTLVFPKTDGTVEPWLAKSWEISPDNLKYTFHLNSGVKFHDGSDLLASDVVYSMKRLLAIGQGSSYLFEKNVKTIEAHDDHTVVITINEPYALFILTMVRFSILNEDLVKANTKKEGQYGEFGDYGTDWLLTHDAGSGPYMVKDVQLNEYVLLERNDNWWAKDKFVKNAADEIRFIPSPQAATLRTLMSNRELEISDRWQSSDTIKSVSQIDGIGLAKYGSTGYLHIMMNTTLPPLDDVHCRRAISYAFDYQAAAKMDWEGTPTQKGPIVQTLAGHAKDIVPYVYDVEKAKAELAQCKYAGQLDKYPIQFHWVTEVPDEEKLALLTQANLKAIGMNVEVVGTPWLTITEMFTKPETTPGMLPMYQNSDLPDAGSALKQRWHSSTVGTTFQTEWLRDKEFDKQIEEALTILDDEARYKKYAELQKYINDLAPALFVIDQLEKNLYQKYVDWPVNNGIVYPYLGYNQFFAYIGVNPHQ